MKILLTGGGTGGHIYPAIGLAQRCVQRGDQVLYVGKRGGLEERLVPAAGFALKTISAAPLQRKVSPALFSMVTKNFTGFREALKTIEAFRPDAVLATGGYVAFPVMAAAAFYNRFQAKSKRAMLGLLEPNAVAGLTNRLLAPLVDEMWGPFPTGAGSSTRFHRTGTPVREAYLHAPTRVQAAQQFGLDASRKIILVIGGSQGARSLNAALAHIFTEPLARHWQFVQIAGNDSMTEAQRNGAQAIERGEAKVYGYLDDPIAAYAAADIVVARAGASTLAELAALGKPALLIPYPFATDDHQRKNAEAYVESGAGQMLLDMDLSGDRLVETLDQMLEGKTLHALTLSAQKLSAEDAATAILSRVSSYRTF